MLAHLVLGREPNFDDVFSHIPPVGRHRRAPRVLPDGGRLIKSHERRALPHAPCYRKAVYLVRDGRDVSVSYYEWYLRNGLYEGGFEGFLPLFLAGRLDGFGAWHEHVRSWLTSAPARANALLVVRYEDLLARPAEGLAEIAEFVGLDPSREQVEEAVSRSTLDRTRGRPQRARHPPSRDARGGTPDIARGSSGQWRRILTPRDGEMFQRVAGDVLAELGYADSRDPGTDAPEAPPRAERRRVTEVIDS